MCMSGEIMVVSVRMLTVQAQSLLSGKGHQNRARHSWAPTIADFRSI